MRSGKIIAFYLILTQIVSCTGQHSSAGDERAAIKSLFFKWRNQQIAIGKYWAADSCNEEFVSSHPIKINDPALGLYDTSNRDAYSYFFADLNNDNKLDGLICFTPNYCAGGTGGKWIRRHVLITSAKKEYSIIDSFDLTSVSPLSDDGFYYLDSISTGKIFASNVVPKDTLYYKLTYDYFAKKVINIDTVSIYVH